jgi:putative aldouronate transport system substrate-binding protein
MEKYPSVRVAITAPDGHIYSLPRVCDFQPGLIGRYPLINLAWLERVGLEPAETSEGFLNMLRAFRDNDANGNGDPTDEVPYSSHNPVHAFRGISGMFDVDYQVSYDVGSLGRYPMKIENGKLRIQLTDPGMRDALEYYTTMYQEKLLDQEIFIHAKKDYFAKLAAGRVGFTPLFQPKNAGKYAGEYDAMYPPSGPGGVRKWNFGNPFLTNTNSFSITHVNRYPEATMRWVDYFYGDEGGLQMYLVRPEEFTTRDADGNYVFKKEVFEAEMGFTRFMGSHTIYPGGSEPTYANAVNYRPMMVGPMLDYIKKVEDYLPSEVVVLPIRSQEDQERELEIRSQMDTYILEMWANFATGEVSFDDWDKWVSTLEKMGLRELEAILQRALSGN